MNVRFVIGVAVLLAACPPPASTGDAGADSGVAMMDAGATDAGPVADPPIVILMIGDGMGPGQLETASRFAHPAGTSTSVTFNHGVAARFYP